MARHPSVLNILLESLEGMSPPERLTPSEAAERYRILNNPGAYHGPYLNETTPYMAEPLDILGDPTKKACIFVGPAQTGKTDSLILNAILYAVKCNPIDTIVYQTSQTVAADFSRTRVDRMHRHSPEVGKHLLPAANADTVHAKYYDSGIVLNLSWPTINEMSGRPRGLVLLTDYDRMPQNIDGEGSPFDLGQKRTTTFRSRGKTVAESSPGFEIHAGSAWIPSSTHEAPPCDGIMALYNRGDRRRWNWKCPSCREWFEPRFEHLIYPTECSPGESGRQAYMACPKQGCVITPAQKYDVNKGGRWVKDGQRLTEDDELIGEAVESTTASFWLMGVAAAFAPWSSLVEKYRQAEIEYERTGSQEALMATVNTDQGVPYRRRGQNVERNPEDLKARADGGLRRAVVPLGVRFLLATIDIQGQKFVVQVHGILPGNPYDVAVIDRFDITHSKRKTETGDNHFLNPAAYIEDWDTITEQVLQRSYPLGDGSGGSMRIKMTFCDSGGKEGVTTQAYQYWLNLRAKGVLHSRFQLLKGTGKPAAPRAAITYPDSTDKSRNASAKGEVPVLMLGSNILKDMLDNRLSRAEGSGGSILLPEWPEDSFFAELCVEVRTEKGWENEHRRRNETWDLLYYCLGACTWMRVDNFDWTKPPSWAEEWGKNTLVSKPEEEVKFRAPLLRVEEDRTTIDAIADMFS